MVLNIRLHWAGALALAVWLLAGGAANAGGDVASGPIAVTPESLSAAAPVAEAVLDMAFTPDNLSSMTQNLAQSFPASWPKPWTGFIGDALIEQIRVNRPRLVQPLSEFLAGRFSTGELRAGGAFLSSPGAKAYIAYQMRPGSPELDPATLAQARDAAKILTASADGKGFAAKLPGAQQEIGAVTQRAVVGLLPGVFIGFAQRIEADQARNASPPNERDRLDAQLACEVFPEPQLRQQFQAQITNQVGPMFSSAGMPASWSALFSQAADEEFALPASSLCPELGRILGRNLSIEQTRTAAAFFATPAGRAFQSMVGEVAANRKPTPPPPALMRRMEIFADSPLGKQLLGTLGDRQAGQEAGMAWAMKVTPPLYERFGELALAAEAQSASR